MRQCHFRPQNYSKAFSLMEMLMVIAIIGIVVNMALFAFGGARGGAEDVRDRRNAQEIATVAACAKAAGADFVVPGDEAATVQNLVAGAQAASGVFKGRTFKVPPMEEHAVAGAMKFLALHEAELVYQHSP
jgi:prepilin-type N-terminal cleavage/methylation domain-containing protein